MKKISSLALAFAAVALASTTAFAEGRWPNWYVGLHGSLAFVGTTELDDNPVVSSYDNDLGYSAGASIGYRPGINNAILRNMRMELEWNYVQTGMDTVDTTFGTFAGHGNTITSAVMGNVFYDFVMTDQYRRAKPFMPYVGAGLGWANVKLEDADTTLGNTNDSDQVLAYQFMAGISYMPQVLPFTEWSLGYRYFDTMDPEFSYLGGNQFSADVASHNLEAGVRFLF